MNNSTKAALAFVLGTASFAHAQVVNSDDFTSDAANPDNWTVFAPYFDSSLTFANGSLALANGAAGPAAASFATALGVDSSFAPTAGAYNSFGVFAGVGEFSLNGFGASTGGAASLTAATNSLITDVFYSAQLLGTEALSNLNSVSGGTPLSPSTVTSEFVGVFAGWNQPVSASGGYVSAGIAALEYVDFVAIPEPSAYAPILGALAFGFAAIYRKRKPV